MINNINNFGTINFYESNSANTRTESKQVEDIAPISSSNSDIPDSIIFTKKARQENKIPTIIGALRKSTIGRNDKTRALVQELQSWQKEAYIDAHYNAQVMYDELAKIMPLTFEYDTFRKYYNSLI